MTLEEKLRQLREVAEKATPGPWREGVAIAGHYVNSETENIEEELCGCGPGHIMEQEGSYGLVLADAKFISKCNPQIVLILLEVIEYYKEALESLEGTWSVRTDDINKILAKIE